MSAVAPGSPRSPIAWALLASTAALSVAGWVAADRRAASESGDEAVLRGVAVVKEGFREGDAVFVVPTWEERPWEALRGAGPGAGAPPFPAFLRGGRLDPVDVLGRKRAWVLGVHGREPVLPGVDPADLALVAHDDLGGGVSVSLFEVHGFEVRARLTESLGRLSVSRRAEDGTVTRCKPRGDRHDCPGPGWTDVRIEAREVFHGERRWLYAHPGPGASALAVDWPDLPEGVAIVRAGWSQAAPRHAPGARTTLRVLEGEAVRWEASFEPHEYTLSVGLVPVTAGAALRFEVSSPDPEWRDLMLEAEVASRLPRTLEPGRRP